jgi:tRNA-dihydrouridine synthase B
MQWKAWIFTGKDFKMAEPKQASFWVGNVAVYGNLILSPMDGISDLPFRVLTRRLGSAMSYTEFINSMDVVNHYKFLPDKLEFWEEERPLVYQIYDDNPNRMLRAALELEQRRPDIIDVNMGCPAKSVSSRGAGAGLLREPRKIIEIMQKLTANLSVPVTAKIRLGWDDGSRNFLEVAKIIEGEGGKLLAVHGRTRVQNYGGEADWDAIAEIKRNLKIPVIGNGDVRTREDIQRMMLHTGCEGVMIGRAAIENPWIFSGLNREQVSPERVYQTIIEHCQTLINFYGPRGLVLSRKFVKRYLKPYPISTETIHAMMICEDFGQFIDLLDDAYQPAASWAL